MAQHTKFLTDPYLLSLLSERAPLADQSAFVFPGSALEKQVQEPRAQIARVVKDSGVAFTLHDLRRTFCTVAESLDISHYALKRLLNHRMAGDVTAGYIGKNVERLREPMQRITTYILSAAGQRSGAAVIPFSLTSVDRA